MLVTSVRILSEVFSSLSNRFWTRMALSIKSWVWLIRVQIRLWFDWMTLDIRSTWLILRTIRICCRRSNKMSSVGMSPASAVTFVRFKVAIKEIVIPTSSSSWSILRVHCPVHSSHGSHDGNIPVVFCWHMLHLSPSTPSRHTHIPVNLSHTALVVPSGWQSHTAIDKYLKCFHFLYAILWLANFSFKTEVMVNKNYQYGLIPILGSRLGMGH